MEVNKERLGDCGLALGTMGSVDVTIARPEKAEQAHCI